MKKIVFAAMALGLVALPQPAAAHKVVMNLFSDFDVIDGDVGFASGDMMPMARVDIYDEEKNRLGVVATDQNGIFHFKPTKCVTHIFRTNLGAGHVLEKKILKDDMPSAVCD